MKEQIRDLYDSGALATKNNIKDVRDLHEDISPVHCLHQKW